MFPNSISLLEGTTGISTNDLNVSDPESDELSIAIKPNYSFIIGGLANGSTNPGYANDYDDLSSFNTFGSSDGSTYIVNSDTNLSGNYKIRISGAGISGFAISKDSSAGTDDGKNHFYIISVKQGLLSASFKINETTETGFKQSN